MKRRWPTLNQLNESTCKIVDQINVNKLFVEKELKRLHDEHETRYYDDSDDENNDKMPAKNHMEQENPVNQNASSSNVMGVRVSCSNTDFNQNILTTKNTNVPTDQFRKSKPMIELNQNIDFDKIVSGPSYVRGQLIKNSPNLHTQLVQSYSSKRAKLCHDENEIP